MCVFVYVDVLAFSDGYMFDGYLLVLSGTFKSNPTLIIIFISRNSFVRAFIICYMYNISDKSGTNVAPAQQRIYFIIMAFYSRCLCRSPPPLETFDKKVLMSIFETHKLELSIEKGNERTNN